MVVIFQIWNLFLFTSLNLIELYFHVPEERAVRNPLPELHVWLEFIKIQKKSPIKQYPASTLSIIRDTLIE